MSDVITLGCRLNLAESEGIRALLPPDEDVVVINSCAVTAEAVRATRQAIRRARRERPHARLLVTGCASELEPEAFAAMAEVSGVVANDLKLDASAYLRSPYREERQARSVRESEKTHARTFIPVQNGCDHDCTFCVTTFARGSSRSTPIETVVEAIARAVDTGHNEAVLTGVDLTSYGLDLPDTPSLAALVERILRDIPALPRLRLSSLDSIEIDDQLIALFAGEPRLMPHVHLSLQSGDDLILKRMKRRHSRADAVALVERLKHARPGIAIGADLIAGFPTETDAQFERSLALLDDCDIVHAHIFPYSPRPGTAAARMPRVPRDIARARTARLREAAAARHARWLAGMVASEQTVLIELDGETGHTENFARVTLSLKGRGEIIRTLITASTSTRLIATPV